MKPKWVAAPKVQCGTVRGPGAHLARQVDDVRYQRVFVQLSARLEVAETTLHREDQRPGSAPPPAVRGGCFLREAHRPRTTRLALGRIPKAVRVCTVCLARPSRSARLNRRRRRSRCETRIAAGASSTGSR